jgi:hypothetical protein
VDLGTRYSVDRIKQDATTIVLEEGDIMYHPAGIWHSVLSVTDSVSINFSLRQLRMADLVTNALRMHMLRNESLRRGVRHSAESLHEQLANAIKETGSLLASIKPDRVLVPSLTIPRAVYVDLDTDQQAKTIALRVGDTLQVSQLYLLSSVNRMPQNGMSKGDRLMKYVVNGLFGNEDFESISRVTLVTKNLKTSKILDGVTSVQASKVNKSLVVTSKTLKVYR